MTSVGIDAMEIWTGKLVLDLPNTFAPVKGEDPEKYTKGLGLHTSSFPDVYEDIVTMGANAAKKLMDRKGLTPADIGRIDVATESAFDNSKPVSTYIAGCLEQVYDGDFRHANKGERKFACIAGTQSLDDAYNWIKAGRNRGRAALVIATDTALYARDDPGEATQGAGAVAMLIDEDPDLVELSTEQGYGSMDETDFLKPNQQFPSVDGKRSMQVYLARMREALEDYAEVAGDIHPGATDDPSIRRSRGWSGRPQRLATDASFAAQTSATCSPRKSATSPAFGLRDRRRVPRGDQGYMDELTTTEQYRDWYGRVIEPTLDISSRVGNWYTGSVHIARLSALKAAARGKDMTGKQLARTAPAHRRKSTLKPWSKAGRRNRGRGRGRPARGPHRDFLRRLRAHPRRAQPRKGNRGRGVHPTQSRVRLHGLGADERAPLRIRRITGTQDARPSNRSGARGRGD